MLRLQGSGVGDARTGFVLIPMDTANQCSTVERDITGLAGSPLQQHGSFTNLAHPVEYINTSRDFAKRVRKAVENEDSWECAVPAVRWRGRVTNKNLRSQNGAPCYAALFDSLLNTTTRKYVTVFDWIAAIGDRAEGALTELSNPNQSNSSKLFYTGFENRAVMYETTRARVRHFIGQKYLDTTLSVNDRVPVLDPGSLNAACVNSEDIGSKLKVCTIRSDKSIKVPLYPEQKEQMPFASSHPDIPGLFKELEDEFPKIYQEARERWAQDIQENNGGTPGGSGGTHDNDGGSLGAAALALTKPCAFTEEEATAVGWKPETSFAMTDSAPQSSQSGLRLLKLVLFKFGSQNLVSLYNPTDSPVKMPGGTFIGQGGEGSYVDVSQVPEKNVPGVWLFNRLCDFKRDIKDKASGGIVFLASESSQVDVADVKIDLLETASAKVDHNTEFTIYAHKILRAGNRTSITPAVNPIVWIPKTPSQEDVFDMSRVGMWLQPQVKACPDPVTPQGVPIFEGVVRSAFAMYMKGMQLSPITNNPLCIFLSKQVIVPPKKYFTMS